MVHNKRLLADLMKLLRALEADLRGQLQDRDDVRQRLLGDYQAARQAARTQDTFDTWVEEPLTQAAVAWILGTVFQRFLEDNGLVEPRLSGTGPRRTRAMQQHQHFVQQHPTSSDRDYLEFLFARLLDVPATAALFDRAHNPLWRVPISADAARQIVEFWQRIDPDSGELVHGFEDEALDTRFLGDLYQDLSESVRKRYALLQTPRFVEAFILDRTLTPAIETFGYREVTLIDPTCGSGHFLLGAFQRLLDLAQTHEPGKDVRALAQDALARIAGIDVNPYAVAISRFRLMVAAVRACGIERLADAPGFDIRVAAADSLLHGPRFARLEDGAVQASRLWEDSSVQYYFAEDEVRVKAILGRQYHAVVGNPPYITVKDPALNALYRQRFGSCHGQYSLVVPFVERFVELAISCDDTRPSAGYFGMIVAKSFTKRQFGKKIIEKYLPQWDLTHLVDTSGAYIPGHGTPTVLIFGRHRNPVSDTVRVVMSIKGEPSTPTDPGRAIVWSAILRQIDQPGSDSGFISVSDVDRSQLANHPWSLGGGGATELLELLNERATEGVLGRHVTDAGRTTVLGEDDIWLGDRALATRQGFASNCVELVLGVDVRDWTLVPSSFCIYPYDSLGGRACRHVGLAVFTWLWPYRTLLKQRTVFGKSLVERNQQWYEHLEHYVSKLRTPLSITFAFVATHNHFALDRGGKIFNKSALLIKLPLGRTEEDHFRFLSLLNSSTACFWLKQLSHNQGSTIDEAGARQRTAPFEDFYQFNATTMLDYPVVQSGAATNLAQELDSLGARLGHPLVNTGDLDQAKTDREHCMRRAIALQEELDWEVYRAYGLLAEPLTFKGDPPPFELGQRAFEIVMARRMAAGELETTWFERHGSTPIMELPANWPDDYRRLVERRIELIENDRYIGLIEQPEYKRRWNLESFEDRLKRELRSWLLDRLEAPEYWDSVAMTSAARLADKVRGDERFTEVAEVYTGQPDFDVSQLIASLVSDESVPFLPVLRHAETGLTKRAQWEETWRLQRLEDTIDARVSLPTDDPARLTEAEAAQVKAREVGAIPVPPKYTGKDFLSQSFWRLRGKLDVPKERFVSYPGCERRADGSLAITWAGWNHAQQARAIGGYYMQLKGEEGSGSPKLLPLLAGLLELLPWLRQWHPGLDPESGTELAPFYEAFVDSEARAMGLTLDDVRRWQPPAAGARRRGRKSRPG